MSFFYLNIIDFDTFFIVLIRIFQSMMEENKRSIILALFITRTLVGKVEVRESKQMRKKQCGDVVCRVCASP